MERPGVVWGYSVLIVLGICIELFTYVFLTIVSILGGISVSLKIIIPVIVELVLIALRAVMIYYFFTLKKNAALWAKICFGASLAVSLIYTTIYFTTITSPGGPLFEEPSLTGIFVSIFWWWAITDYVKKKQIDDKPVFT